MKKELEEKIIELYGSGELTLSELKKVKDKFDIVCKFCKSQDIAIMVKDDNDKFCESCSSPYAIATIKCKKCGQAISIRS